MRDVNKRSYRELEKDKMMNRFMNGIPNLYVCV